MYRGFFIGVGRGGKLAFQVLTFCRPKDNATALTQSSAGPFKSIMPCVNFIHASTASKKFGPGKSLALAQRYIGGRWKSADDILPESEAGIALPHSYMRMIRSQ